MKESDLSGFLAVEVMGWHKGETWTWRKFNTAYFNSEKYDPNLASDEQTNYIIADNWSPPTNIEQAMMCMKASTEFSQIMLGLTEEDEWWAVLDTGMGSYKSDLHRTDAEAISLAVARAHGYEDIK